ncbi:hypothetical protein PhCBS80983_g03314 [Powellomyces hirtus]|uniref:cellulase n=1 Tax=Powellomyces hirtus TaxID=109895 RepID=A0A507E472_9FUNG|nr:hypothetical protein PhCBS80983_g03314 [Powellomyces hirtus]
MKFLVLFSTVLTALTSQTVTAAKHFQYTGVSESCAEFGQGNLPGTYNRDYTYPTDASLDFFIKGCSNLIRLPFAWERLQRTLEGELDAEEFSRIDGVVKYVTGRGQNLLLDPHNYNRYRGQLVTPDQLANFWTKLANRYKDNQKVMFGLMNEPHDQPTEDVFKTMQAAINAIRATTAKNLITVPGNAWTGAHSWTKNYYGTSNAEVMATIVDPANNFMFEMHQYLDSDFSGTHDTCQSASIGVESLVAATEWARKLGKKILLGEIGGGDNALCYAALENTMKYMMENSDVWAGYAWWAAGPWWGNYMFSVEPNADSSPKPQWTKFLQRYTQCSA